MGALGSVLYLSLTIDRLITLVSVFKLEISCIFGSTAVTIYYPYFLAALVLLSVFNADLLFDKFVDARPTHITCVAEFWSMRPLYVLSRSVDASTGAFRILVAGSIFLAGLGRIVLHARPWPHVAFAALVRQLAIYSLKQFTYHAFALTELLYPNLLMVYGLTFGFDAMLETARTARMSRFAALALCMVFVLDSFNDHRISMYLEPSYESTDTTALATNNGIFDRISVLEHNFGGQQQIRVMRAGHSLLGGVWIGHARQQARKRLGSQAPNSVVTQAAIENAESIYTTFYLQEAILLADVPPTLSNEALVIGLGIGISAKTLMQAKLNVSICEIEPVIYRYAQEYFGLPEPTGGVYLQDARQVLPTLAPRRFRYIIHDVFTGGSVPSMLFTLEMWSQITRVLQPGGILAVNFAGQLQSDASTAILSTLVNAFKTCRAFNDGEMEVEHANMVIFCTQSSTLQFKPYNNERASGNRKRTLTEFQRFEINLANLTSAEPKFLLADGTASRLTKWQEKGALQHWAIMRQQFPPSFWEAR